MRSGVVLLLVSAVALSVLSGAAGSPSSQRLVPTAVVFVDRTHGVLGLASPHCTGCTASGAIAMTSDGGKTWRVIIRTRCLVSDEGSATDLLCDHTPRGRYELVLFRNRLFGYRNGYPDKPRFAVRWKP